MCVHAHTHTHTYLRVGPGGPDYTYLPAAARAGPAKPNHHTEPKPTNARRAGRAAIPRSSRLVRVTRTLVTELPDRRRTHTNTRARRPAITRTRTRTRTQIPPLARVRTHNTHLGDADAGAARRGPGRKYRRSRAGARTQSAEAEEGKTSKRKGEMRKGEASMHGGEGSGGVRGQVREGRGREGEWERRKRKGG